MTGNRPEWLTRLEPDEGRLSDLWTLLLAHVSKTANESGFFAPEGGEWLVWSGLNLERSWSFARVLESVGALERAYGRLYVVGWRERYRVPDRRFDAPSAPHA